MKVLVFILCILTFKYSSSEVNDTYKLCDEIMALGKHLPIIFNELPASQSDKVIQDIRQYNAKMRQLVDLVKSDIQNMQQPLTYLLNDGYPKYLGFKVPSDKLKQSFNWTDRDVERLKALRRASYLEYGELVSLHETPFKFID